ncbi:MAG: hypothetical protein R3C15_19685 [Thermoleophilia bacterium]
MTETEGHPPTPPIGAPVVEGPPPGPGAYCNFANIKYSGWDFAFDFAQQDTVFEEGSSIPKIVVFPIGRIMMSPRHARPFSALCVTPSKDWREQTLDLTPGMKP